MTVSEYIKHKNKLIFDEIGLTLVPDNQIKECKQYKLNIMGDTEACPYCLAYINDSCDECQMSIEGNSCNFNSSTYQVTISKMKSSIVNSSIRQKLVELIEQYNKEL